MNSAVSGRTVAWGLLCTVTCAFLAGCGAAFAPPGRADIGFSASKSLEGQHEVEATAIRIGSKDDTTIGDVAYQLAFRSPVGEGRAVELSYFGHDIPGDEYGWGLVGLALRQRLGGRTERLNFVVGLTSAAGVGGRWPGYEEGDRRFPRAISAGLDIGVRLRTDNLVTGSQLFLEHRIMRSFSTGGRENHAPPTTDWTQTSLGARIDVGRLYANAALSSATWTNHQSDGAQAPMFGMAVGFRFGQ